MTTTHIVRLLDRTRLWLLDNREAVDRWLAEGDRLLSGLIDRLENKDAP